MLSRWPVNWRGRYLVRHGRKAEYQKKLEHEVTRWSRRLLHHIKMRLTVKGAENLPQNGEVVVYVANHQSYLDIPVLLGTLDPPPPLMARQEIGKVPVLGGWMRHLDCVFVERDNARAGIAAMKQAEQVLQSGKSLVVFPEGTRSKSDEVGEFMPGAVRIASRAGVPVVPLAIDGTYKGLEGNHYRVAKTDVTLTVLPRVETNSLSKPEQKELPKRLEEMIRTAKAKDGTIEAKSVN